MLIISFIVNVGVALVMGVAIGVERQIHQHPAGLRTNSLVCVGAALFVSLTRLMGDGDSPTRVASYIVSGIGFLCGGVILRDGLTVKGLNTAATLWCSAAVGTLAGAGFPLHSLIGTLTVLAVHLGLRPVGHQIDLRREDSSGRRDDVPGAGGLPGGPGGGDPNRPAAAYQCASGDDRSEDFDPGS